MGRSRHGRVVWTRRRVLLLFGSVFGLVIAIAAVLGLVRTGGDGTAPLGTTVGGVDIGGMTTSQAETAVTTALSRGTTTVTANGMTITAKTSDLITPTDLASDVIAAMASRPLYTSLLHVGSSFPVTVRSYALDDRAAVNGVIPIGAVSDATIEWVGSKWAVRRGVSGVSVDMDALMGAFGSITAEDSSSWTVSTTHVAGVAATVGTIPGTKPITPSTIANVVRGVNAILGRTYAIQVKGEDARVIPASARSSWVSFSPQSGSVVAVISRKAIASTIDSTTRSMRVAPVNTVIVTSPDGDTDIATTTAGRDGSEVTASASGADTIRTAVMNGSDATVSAVRSVLKSSTTRERAESDWSKADGTPWIEVNTARGVAYAYRGSTLVRTMTITESSSWTGSEYVRSVTGSTARLTNGLTMGVGGGVSLGSTDAAWTASFVSVGTLVRKD